MDNDELLGAAQKHELSISGFFDAVDAGAGRRPSEEFQVIDEPAAAKAAEALPSMPSHRGNL